MLITISLRHEEDDDVYCSYGLVISEKYRALWNQEYCELFPMEGQDLFNRLNSEINRNLEKEYDINSEVEQTFVWYKDVEYGGVTLLDIQEWL